MTNSKTVSVFNYAAALVIILSLNFILPRMMPGDPLQAIYGDEATIAMTPELKAELANRFSLDRPLGQQFITYFIAGPGRPGLFILL